jgi:hypothetical protein
VKYILDALLIFEEPKKKGDRKMKKINLSTNHIMKAKTRRSKVAIVTATIALIATMFSTTALASGSLVNGATIKAVLVRNVAGEAFTIKLEGGSGPCSGGNIRFPSTGNDSLDSRMLSVALTAYASGQVVSAYDYGSGTDCDAADYIKVGE